MFKLVALLILIPLGYVLAYFVKRFTANSYEEELFKLFSFYWNGEPEDEIYAWMKVRSVLENREEAEKKIQYVNRKISSYNRESLCGSLKVDSNGELLSDKRLKE